MFYIDLGLLLEVKKYAFVGLSSIKNDNNIIISNQCNIQDLCEQLPMLMKKLMSAVEDKNFIKEIVLYFDVNKNLTTKRVLMSFMLGFFDNKIKVIEH